MTNDDKSNVTTGKNTEIFKVTWNQHITRCIDSRRQVYPSKHFARVLVSATLTDTPSTVNVGTHLTKIIDTKHISSVSSHIKGTAQRD